MTERRVSMGHTPEGSSSSLEEELRLAEARLDEAQRIAKIGSWQWNLVGREDWWSDELYRILGLDPKSCAPSIEAFMQRVHPLDRARLREGVERVSVTGALQSSDIRIVTPDGREKIVHSQGTATLDAVGRIVRMYGTLQDVTDRRAAENQLRRNELRLREAQRMAEVASWESDLRKKEDWWSDELYAILEEDPATCEPSLETFLAKLHPHDRARLEESRRKNRASGSAQDLLELRVLLSGGKQKVIKLHVEVHKDEDGRASLVSGTMHDITDRVALEREIVATSEHERSRIGYDLHDGLGQQLTGISLALEALGRRLRDSDSPETRSAHALQHMVQDCIAETRRIARSLSPGFWNGHFIDEALHALANEVSMNGDIRCVVDRADRDRGRSADEMAHLYRIAQEAVNNSLKHGKAGNIGLRYERTGDMAALIVRDDGCGIPDDGSCKEGLGLRSMRYRARMLNGSLEITRREGGGTEVRCVFRAPPGLYPGSDATRRS